MTEVFKRYIQDRVALSADQWSIIERAIEIKNIRKHQYLLQEGDIWRFNAFVCEGCLRRYRIDEKGAEHILQFSIENWWAGDRESLVNGTPSKYNIDAIENSTVLLIRKESFDQLCKEIPPFGDMVNRILSRSLDASQDRIHAAISFTAEEKYLDFINTYPKLASRVPRHMLASYLGITPETLSRIRNNAAKR